MSNRIEPTDEQQRILDEDGNIVVIARPGSGKTYTIVKKIEKILTSCYEYQGIIAISYTKRASRELAQRCRIAGISKKASFFGTIDNFYISEIIMPFTKHLFDKKVDLQIEASLDEFPQYGILRNLKDGITNEMEEVLLHSLLDGHIFLEISGETALYLLKKIPEVKQYIQARYTHIFIDEYQDCGMVQHKIFMELVQLGLIGIAVGDIDQAIYAFANRYSKYLESLANDERFYFYKINKNHRCHKSIEAYSLQLLGIKQPIPNSEEMRVFKVDCIGSEIDLSKRIAENMENIKKEYNVKNNSDIGILCRNNGSARLISENLGIQNKLFVDNQLDVSHYQWSRFFADLLRDYFDEETFPVDVADRYFDEEFDGENYKKFLKIVRTIFDKEASELRNHMGLFKQLGVLLYPEYQSDASMAELKSVLQSQEQMNGYKPPDENEICIMTLHKSKGLEFDIVFHMDLYDWTFPRRDIPKNEYMQDLNLHYVGVTRAKKACFIMQGTYRYRQRRDDFFKAEKSPFLDLHELGKYRKNIRW